MSLLQEAALWSVGQIFNRDIFAEIEQKMNASGVARIVRPRRGHSTHITNCASWAEPTMRIHRSRSHADEVIQAWKNHARNQPGFSRPGIK
jgi:hypothetical protein